MTSQETITPSTDTETTPQASGGDPFRLGDIPGFLRRTPMACRETLATAPAVLHKPKE